MAKSSLAQAPGSAAPMPMDADLAACYAQTAANFVAKGWWVEAYIELHHAAEICWRNGKEQRNGRLVPKQNAKITSREGAARNQGD